MRYVDLSVRLPDELLHPMSAVIRHRDLVAYEELLSWNVWAEEGVETELFYVEADPEPYRAAVETVETVREYSLAPIDGASFHLWVREETRPEVRAWRSAFARRALVLVPPVRFDSDAVMGMTVVGDGEEIQAVLAEIPESVDVTVNEIGSYDRRGGTLAGALTDRQLEVVRTALATGYYEVPRGATLADVADAVGCAQSSASVVLRRAERAVLSRVLERYGGTVGARDATVSPDS